MNKNNKGFIATAVLYSLAALIALILFLILRNVATARKINSEDADSVKSNLLKYEVVYDANGGTGDPMENTIFNYGKVVKMPTCTYEKIGYDCVGWAKETTGEIAYANQESVKNITAPNTSITLYAYYTEHVYLLTLDPNGGTLEQTTAEAVYNGTYNLPTPTKTGYDFAGWFYTENETEVQIKTGDIVTITEDKTLIAHWTPKTFTVTLNANGGSVSPTSITVTYDSTYGLPTPTRSGHSFNGWFTSASGGDQINATDTVKITSNTTLYAQWTVLKHTVTYNYSANGGTSSTITSAEVAEGSSISLSPTATKSGWSFVGWNTSKTATTKLSSLSMGSSDVILYAIYSKIITVTFVDYNGTTKTTRTKNATIYNTSTAASISTYALNTAKNNCGNYSSLGWTTSTSATASVTHSASTSYSFSSNTTLYGRYNQDTTFWIDRNGGSASTKSVTQTRNLNGYGSKSNDGPYTYTFASNCSRSGYTFLGWYRNSDGSGPKWSGNSVSYSCGTMYSAYWQ